MRTLLLTLLLVPAVALADGAASNAGYIRIPGGAFKSALKYEDTQGKVFEPVESN